MSSQRPDLIAGRFSPSLLLIWLALLIAPAIAAEPDSFRRQVAPILARHCVSCHNAKDKKGDFSLQTAEALRASGNIEAGKPDESHLVEMITPSHGKAEMPKAADPLSASELATIRQWIVDGAPWPADYKIEAAKVIDTNWWSLKEPHRPAIPALAAEDAKWVRTPLDSFVMAKLRERDLTPSAEADRRTLIRRLYFDLIGLPPTPEQTAAFLGDTGPDAYERLVDQLLDSPRYGERWARHWLDVVHYGDSHGFDKDQLRPNAWPYRDYVIRALNNDKPYERFILEQIAGDVLWPGTEEGIVATGFVAAGPYDFVGQVELAEGTKDKKQTRNLDRDDMVTTTMNSFVSLTVQCARCHNHKFDPITSEDYYSLQAVFAGVDRADRPFGTAPAAASPTQVTTQPSGSQTNPSAPTVAAPPRLVFAAASNFEAQVNFLPTHGKPRQIFELHRGDVELPLKEVGPGTVSCVAGLPARFKTQNGAIEGPRRVALARWIADPRNPLTWRSIVNRIWQYHFGQGIVATPNDFGRMGVRPTHPELLDWLAVEFRDGGQSIRRPQSIKQLQRLIVTSAVYRQSSQNNERFATIDSGNQYLWRMSRRRLEAEAIRDSVLAVSGVLDLTMYGPGFRTFGVMDAPSPHYLYDKYDPADPASHRRSIYRAIVRSVPDPFMETLDCADPSASVATRGETLTPLQALSLMNNRFMVAMAERFAARVAKGETDVSTQVAAAFQLALGRPPDSQELSVLVKYAGQHGLPSMCRLLLNTNEFIYVD